MGRPTGSRSRASPSETPVRSESRSTARARVARLASLRELGATGGEALRACVLEVAVRTVPLPRIVASLGISMAYDESARSDTGRPLLLTDAERRRLRAVGRVMRRWRVRGCGGTCLRSALLNAHALRGRGPTVLLGVRHGDHGIEAHAWVEVEGFSLGHHPGFVPLGVSPSIHTE